MKKQYRIKKSKEIQQLIKHKTTVGNSYFVLYYQKNHENNNFRYALSVPKRYGNAVERNLIKRRIREIIKVNNFLNDYDFLVLENMFAKAKILGE